MTIDLRNSFEGGTNGTVISTVNSGGTSGDAFTATASGTVFDTFAAHGGMAMKITAPGAVAQQVKWAPDGTLEAFAARFYLYIDALPGVDCWLTRFLNSTTAIGNIEVSAAGNLVLLNQTSTAAWTSSSNLPTGEWVRVEVWIDVGTSTSTGQGKIAYYVGDQTTAVESSAVLTGQNFLGANITQINFGKCNGTDVTSNLWFDDLALSTGATDYIGPVVTSTPPTGSGTFTDNMARLQVTTSGGVAPYTYAIVQTSGPTTAPISVGTGQWLVAKHATDDLYYQVTIQDGTGQTSDPVNFVVPPLPSSGTLHYFDGTGVITV